MVLLAYVPLSLPSVDPLSFSEVPLSSFADPHEDQPPLDPFAVAEGGPWVLPFGPEEGPLVRTGGAVRLYL